MNGAIVGGHTIVGPRMEIGFTVIGRPLGESLIRKRNLRPGDHLYLTKPLGIGVLLAAHMRSLCPARAYSTLLDAMLQRQHGLAQIAVDGGIDAGTDVTGFGLAGHLIEMLTASDVSAVIELDSVPILPGAIELCDAGIESSLAPDNRKAEARIGAEESVRQTARYRMLFDPQTCGGLLLGVRDDQQAKFLSEVAAIGLPAPARIGRVHQRGDHLLKIEA
jgi:selenide,water dikinase